MMLGELKQVTDGLVVLADQDGFITFAGGAFKEILGWEPDELLGQAITVLIPPRLRDAHHLGFSRFLVTGRPTLLNRPLNLKVLTRGGEELDSEHTILAERQDGQWTFGALIRPAPRSSEREPEQG